MRFVAFSLFSLTALYLPACGPGKDYPWNVTVWRGPRHVKVELHHNDYPEGPSKVIFDGHRMDVARRGGKHTAFLAGPGGFGPSKRGSTALYEKETKPSLKLARPLTLKIGCKRTVTLEDLSYRTFSLVDPAAPVVPGGSVKLVYDPKTAKGDPGNGMGGLEVYFKSTPADGPPRSAKWGDSRMPRPGETSKLVWGEDHTLTIEVPADTPPGPGRLMIMGYMPVNVLTCTAATCSAFTMVDVQIPLTISTP